MSRRRPSSVIFPVKRARVGNNLVSSLPLVEDNSIKGNAIVAEINNDSSVVVHKIGSGKRVPYFEGAEKRNKMQFIQCTNHAKSNPWMIGVKLPKAPSEYNDNSELGDANLVLVNGVFLCEVAQRFKISYFAWKGDSSLSIVDLVNNNKDNTREFIRSAFEEFEHKDDVEETHIVWLNQITGPRCRQWKDLTTTVVPSGMKVKTYQCGVQPDRWCSSNPFKSKPTDVLRVPQSIKSDGCTYLKQAGNEDVEKVLKGSKLRQHKTKKTILICGIERSLISDLSGYFLQVSFLDREGQQLLTPITKKQKKDLDVKMKQAGGKMSIQSFQSLMNQYSEENSTKSFVVTKINLRKQYEQAGTIIISKCLKVPDDFDKELEPGLLYEKKIDENVRDCSVPKDFGFPLFRCYLWSFKKLLTSKQWDLLRLFYMGSKGLERKLCHHEGIFSMLGNKMSNQASSSMFKEASRGTVTDYFDSSKMNETLFPLVRSFVNGLSEQAVQHQNGGTEIVLHLLKRILVLKGVSSQNPQDLCPHNIVTMAFSNSSHRDKDAISVALMKDVVKLIRNSKEQDLNHWLDLFLSLYGEKARLSLPTTCAWSLHNKSDQWTHEQSFVILDLMLCFDLSSDVLEKGEIGATFSGSLFDHATTRSLWISKDKKMVTTLCPDDCYNDAWGRAGGPARSNNLYMSV